MAVKKIVKTEFKASGNLEKKFTLMERAAARFGRTASKSFRKANKGASRFSSTTKGVVAGLGISRGLGLVSQGLGSVVTQFIAFDKAALGATVRFKDIGPEAADFNDQLKKIQKSARDAGATTEFTAAQSAEAMDFLARAGFTSAEAMASLGSMINLATATGEDFNSVADKSSDLLGSFGLNTDNTAQKIKNLNRLNDVLVKTANSANVTIETMFETMKGAAPIGKKLGIELEEMAAVTAVLGNSGIKGTEAQTALKNSFLNLSTQKKPVVDMLNAIGVKVDDGTGEFRGFTAILEDVGEALKGVGSIKQAKVLDTLFGKRAIAGASNLIDGIKDIKKFTAATKGAGQTSKLTAEIMRTSIDAKLKTLGSSATEAGFKILTAFEGDGKNGIDSLTQAVRDFDPTELIKQLGVVLDTVVLIGQSIGIVVSGLTKVGKFSGESAAKTVLAYEKADEKTGGFISDFASGSFNILQGLNELAKGDVLGAGSAILGLDERPGPNQKEAEAKAMQQSVNVGGTINVKGPAGTTAESTGPVGFDTEALGQN